MDPLLHILKHVLQVPKLLKREFLNKNPHADLQLPSMFQSWDIEPIPHKLKLHIHFTKSSKRDNIYKLCFRIQEQHSCLIHVLTS